MWYKMYITIIKLSIVYTAHTFVTASTAVRVSLAAGETYKNVPGTNCIGLIKMTSMSGILPIFKSLARLISNVGDSDQRSILSPS